MNKDDLLRYKNLLLAKQHELSQSRSALPAAGELRADPVDMAARETDAAMQILLQQKDSKLMRAIEDAFARVRDERFGICEACGLEISRARLEAVPWTRQCKDCKEKQSSQT